MHRRAQSQRLWNVIFRDIYLIVGAPCNLQSFDQPDKQAGNAISSQFRTDGRQIYQLKWSLNYGATVRCQQATFYYHRALLNFRSVCRVSWELAAWPVCAVLSIMFIGTITAFIPRVENIFTNINPERTRLLNSDLRNVLWIIIFQNLFQNSYELFLPTSIVILLMLLLMSGDL